MVSQLCFQETRVQRCKYIRDKPPPKTLDTSLQPDRKVDGRLTDVIKKENWFELHNDRLEQMVRQTAFTNPEAMERIYDVMEELDMFPKQITEQNQALIIALDKESLLHGFGLTSKMRAKGANIEIYPDVVKMKKSMKYADARKFPYVIFIGETERETGIYSVKTMETGEQHKYGVDKLFELLNIQ